MASAVDVFSPISSIPVLDPLTLGPRTSADPSFAFNTRSTFQDVSSPFQTSAGISFTRSTVEHSPPPRQESIVEFTLPSLESIKPTPRGDVSFTFSSFTIPPFQSSSSILSSSIPSSGPNIAVTVTPVVYTSNAVTAPAPSTSPETVPTQAVQSGLSTSTLIPLVVLGVAAAVMAPLVTLCMLRRRRRRIAHQDSRIQRDGAHDDRDRFARHSAMVESGALLLPSVRVLSAEAQDGGITPYTHDDSPHTQSQSASPAWTRSSHSKTSQAEMMSARASSFGPPGFDDPGEEPLAPPVLPPREENPITTSTEVSDTVLLRLPVDLARGLIALVAGANVRGGVRYAGESEDGQGSEYLPAYESEPSASEVVASVMPG